jgi:hypothetical protein
MTRILVRQISQLLLLIGPIITLNWSILDWLGYAGTDEVRLNFLLFDLVGPKQVVEFKIRGAVIIVGWFSIFLHDMFEYYVPERDFKKFRSLYLDNIRLEWRKTIPTEIRISIFHARRRWFFPICRILCWTWNDGFEPSDSDANMRLMSWQGVAGQVLKKRKPLLVDFRETRNKNLKVYERWLPFNQFRLWPWQLTKTKEITCILSIPVFISSGEPSPRWHVVGVINLDTLTEPGAEFLVRNHQTLSNDLADYGKIIAYLR